MKGAPWRRAALIGALASAYVLGYAFFPVVPAANMAYYVYADSAAADGFWYDFFLPLYAGHRQISAWLGRPFGRHNRDRPRASLAP